MLFTILSTGVFLKRHLQNLWKKKSQKILHSLRRSGQKDNAKEMVTTDFTFSNPFTPPMNLTVMQGFAQASKNSFEMSQACNPTWVVSSGNTVTIMGIFKGKYVQPLTAFQQIKTGRSRFYYRDGLVERR